MPEQSETTETTYQVLMHFGDGSYKRIEVEATDPIDAQYKAQEWVGDNSFYVCEPSGDPA